MKLNIKKTLKNLFKQAGYSFYKIIYGNIKKIIYPHEDKRIREDNINISTSSSYRFLSIDSGNLNLLLEKVKSVNVSYRVFSISKSRIYNDTTNNLAVIIDDKLVDGPSFQFRDSRNTTSDKNIVLNVGTPRVKRNIKGTVFSLLTGGAGNENYWHWLFDVLPRLEILNKVKNIKEIDYFLFPDLKQKFQNETLNILNIPSEKRLSGKQYRHLEADEIVTVDHPYIFGKNNPSIEIQNIPDWIIKWLKISFLNEAEKKIKNYPKKFYIDRSDATSNLSHTRKITNENNVKDILKKNGFSIIKLTSLTFNEQITLFNNSTYVVGLHGAGFANLVFCNPKTKVLEIKPSTAGYMYKNLAKKNNLNYTDISIEPHEHIYKNQQGFIKVPLEQLDRLTQN